MSITKADAVGSHHGQEFHHITAKNADGTPVRCRSMGTCKTWKTRPNAFRLPVKYGMYDSFYLTEINASEWSQGAW